uniref:Homing endonuclease n=1 Tax=Sphaerobolus stellatus TaxID=68786 RepID=A0A7D4Z6W5_9AGAM|nr:homing endonuclease [Sphaerobolus stellatus]
MTVLTVESIHSIFEKLIPIFSPYSHYFYWKFPQFELMSRLSRLINAKAHNTLYGFSTILDIIYSYPNSRLKSKEFYLDNIQSWFKSQENKNKSGENNIQLVYGRDSLKGQIVAWKCVFPVESKIKSRQFGFECSSSMSMKNALNQAITYRDISIKSWVDSLK